MSNEMTDREILIAIFDKVVEIDKRVDNLETKVDNLETQQKQTQSLLENDIAPKVQTLLENHSELSKKVSFSNNEHERINALEFDVKVIKGILNNKIS